MNNVAAKNPDHGSSLYTQVYVVLYVQIRLPKTECIISNIKLEVGSHDELILADSQIIFQLGNF